MEKDGEEINGKSIMGLMLLAAGCGSRLKVTVTGGDAAGDRFGLLQGAGQALAQAVGRDQSHGQGGSGGDGEPHPFGPYAVR